jgi:hypothetical protein
VENVYKKKRKKNQNKINKKSKTMKKIIIVIVCLVSMLSTAVNAQTKKKLQLMKKEIKNKLDEEDKYQRPLLVDNAVFGKGSPMSRLRHTFVLRSELFKIWTLLDSAKTAEQIERVKWQQEAFTYYSHVIYKMDSLDYLHEEMMAFTELDSVAYYANFDKFISIQTLSVQTSGRLNQLLNQNAMKQK